MGMTKKIEIDGKEVLFKASAAIPRIYRIKFQRDVYKDLSALEKAIGKNVEDASTLDTFSLEMFENIAYMMAKHADANIPDTPEEWLYGFNTFSIYQVLPQLIELWGLNVQLGISIRDLDLLTIGLVNDMYAENSNDDYKGYKEVANQEDFDKF